jgi:RimJ/RimL family protein N-acetyltransferase
MPALPFPEPPLRDDLVELRPWRSDDAPDLVVVLQDAEIPRWTAIPAPYDSRDAREFLRLVEPARRAGRELSLAVAEAEGGGILGGCGLTILDWSDRKAEIGYWIAAGARRRGVGSRSIRLLSRWALDELGLERIEILVNPANEGSQRLALAAGFTREGTLRLYRRRKGVREDLIMFSLLPGDG